MVEAMPDAPKARRREAFLACLLILVTPAAARASAAAPEDMAALFKTTCAICHDVPETKAPPTATLRLLPASQILMAMEFGKMQPQSAVLSQEQRVRLSKWLAAEEDAKRDAWIAATSCTADTPVAPSGRESWGLDRSNARHGVDAVVRREDVASLELLWSIALPAVTTMRSQPVIAGDTVFLGSKGGHLLALDRRSGCVRWAFRTDGPTTTTPLATTGAELLPTSSRPYRSRSTRSTVPSRPKPSHLWPVRASIAIMRRSAVAV